MRPERNAVLYVSSSGDDQWSGKTLTAIGSDGPLGTLEGARNRIRDLRRTGMYPSGGITVEIEGDIFRDGPFELATEDSGSADAPIVYRAGRRGTRLLGGRPVTNWEPVHDADVLRRLPPRARKHVVQTDLTQLGVGDFGTMRRRGFGVLGQIAGLELFFDGEPMTLARWPNVDFVKVTDLPEEGRRDDGWGNAIADPEAGFIFRHPRLKTWRSTRDIWVHGYWCWDWANSYDAVVELNPETGFIRTQPAERHYGTRAGQRFFFLNILEELDRPGEWYLDRDRGVLYFWPPRRTAKRESFVSTLEAPLVRLTDVSNVRIESLGLECARGVGIDVSGGSDVVVSDCGIANMGNSGIRVCGGQNHRVEGCEIAGTGDGGIELQGGHRPSLTPCHHEVVDCHIHHFSRWTKTYCPAILASGVGMRFAHNLIHDAPHTAILFTGNEFLVEQNEIHSVCLETGDAGAVYTGRDYTFRGNVVRRNFIHHMGGFGMGTMGVYNDDCVSGTVMLENVFYRVSRAAMLGGGRELVVENNLFIDCQPAIHFDARGISDHPIWTKMVNETMRERFDAMLPGESPYRDRYPEILAVGPYLDAGKGVPPEGCRAVRNVCVGGRWLHEDGDHAGRYLQERGNVIVESDPGFRNLRRMDFRMDADAAVYAGGFRPIPLDEIGPRVKRRPPRDVVAVRLECPSAEAEGAGSGTRTVHLVVSNPGEIRQNGKAGVWVDPASGARVRGRKRVSFRLEAGEEFRVEVAIHYPKDAESIEVGAYLDREDFVRHRMTLSTTADEKTAGN